MKKLREKREYIPQAQVVKSHVLLHHDHRSVSYYEMLRGGGGGEGRYKHVCQLLVILAL